MVPSSDDVFLNCTAVQDAEGFYNISITVELSDAFTPAVLEAISRLRGSRREVDENMNLVDPKAPIIPFTINEVFDQAGIFDRVLPLHSIGAQYEYAVSK